MNGGTAMKQAMDTSSDYARRAFDDLCKMLGIVGLSGSELRKELTPFAGVWVAMINASASDLHTAVVSGFVDGGGVLVKHQVADVLDVRVREREG